MSFFVLRNLTDKFLFMATALELDNYLKKINVLTVKLKKKRIAGEAASL